jgi:hypothetical protein
MITEIGFDKLSQTIYSSTLVGTFRQMKSYGLHTGVTSALADLVADPGNVLGLPSVVMPVGDDGICRFDEGSLEIPDRRLSHVAEASLAPAGVDGGDEASIAGELA